MPAAVPKDNAMTETPRKDAAGKTLLLKALAPGGPLGAAGIWAPILFILFPFFAGTVKEVWVSGNWADLLSFKVVFSVALFVFSFFIPKIIRTVKGETP